MGFRLEIARNESCADIGAPLLYKVHPSLLRSNMRLPAHVSEDPFGDTLRSTGPRASANPWRFSTKYTDQESGWLYYGYRYYAPKLGRWVSRDPSGEAASRSLHLAFRNCSVSRIDPSGLVDISWDVVLTRNGGPGMGIGFTTPYNSDLDCTVLASARCSGCFALDCRLHAVVAMNIPAGLEGIPGQPQETFWHEMGHVTAYLAFYDRIGKSTIASYEDLCSDTEKDALDLFNELLWSFNEQLDAVTASQSARAEMGAHKQGWDRDWPSDLDAIAELRRFMGTLPFPLR